MEVTIYKQIDSVKTIVSQLIDNIYNDEIYQSYLQDLEENDSEASTKKAVAIKKTFADIKVFGQPTEPLFLASEIGIILGVSSITTMVRNYSNTEKIIGHIMYKGKKTKKTFLTKYGIYRIMFNNKTKLSEVFRGFIYKLIDHMVTNELDTLRNIINDYSRQNPDLINESMLELEGNIKKYRDMLEIEKEERINLETELSFNEMYINQLKMDKINLIDRLSDKTDDMQSDDSGQIVKLLQSKFMKEFDIYLVSPELLNKLFSDDETTVYNASNEIYVLDNYKKMYKYIVNHYNETKFINTKEIYYIVLNYTSKNTTPSANTNAKNQPLLMENTDDLFRVGSEYVFDRTMFAQVIEVLKTECDNYNISKNKKSVSNIIFKVSIDHIKSITHNILLDKASSA